VEEEFNNQLCNQLWQEDNCIEEEWSFRILLLSREDPS
jgi:hypothetical protein